MEIALLGSRWFGAQMLERLMARGHDLHVVAPTEDDRLAASARSAGVSVTVAHNPRRIRPEEIPGDVDLIVGAHLHAFTPEEVRRKARIAAIGYHPSLLPRHRGIAAVEWTIKLGDPIAGGSVYHMSDEMDAGAIAAQDWCFVYPGEDAGELWRRALAPMGLRLLAEVVDFVAAHGYCEARPQDERAITYAPAIKDETVGA
ncbi:formyltransferase family protein [Propylenella binzhouense]|uniref:Methionyl-tRNA formyltransferase n=1 Tax=Propylenella binzhouense TaxID=2555902 RepID=A0A964WU94_9HYPH|nr:formyltransferase family protein [Propylenella binzhouense]MYZ48799.1 methionyl-tRNA formyltransferase [Propylenella binzhouense]